MSTFLSYFSLAMTFLSSYLSSSPEESKDSSSCWELPVNREHLRDMLVDLNSSLGLVLGDLERSLIGELWFDLERLVDLLGDLQDVDLPLGESLPPKLAVSSYWRSRDAVRHRNPWISYN